MGGGGYSKLKRPGDVGKKSIYGQLLNMPKYQSNLNALQM